MSNELSLPDLQHTTEVHKPRSSMNDIVQWLATWANDAMIATMQKLANIKHIHAKTELIVHSFAQP